MNILVFEWETGDFKRDMSYVERIALPDEEVDIVSEEEFNRQVEELRAQRQT